MIEQGTVKDTREKYQIYIYMDYGVYSNQVGMAVCFTQTTT